MPTDALEAIFEQLQVTSAFLLAMEDLRIKNQLSDLIENVVISLLSPRRMLNVWQYIISPIANSSIYYIVSHMSRKVVTRPTALGNTAQIDMDDTTGWEDLELNIKIYQALIRASLPYHDVVTSLWTFPVYDDQNLEHGQSEGNRDPKPAWYILLKECGHHINRHLRENMYHFLLSLFQAPEFKAAYLSLPLTDPLATSSRRWIDVIMTSLPSGLEDDWTQIRYAATMIHEALLGCLNDERWPVKDAACLASGRILRRFPPLQISPVTNEVGALDVEVTNQFLHHWEEHLRDCIWSVRENAAFACAEALVTDTFVLATNAATTSSSSMEASREGIEQWRSLVWRLVSQFIQHHLLTAVGDVDESVDIVVLPSAVDDTQASVTTVQRRVIQSKIESFLPIAMVEAHHEQKRKQLSDPTSNSMAEPPNDEGLLKAASTAAQSYRKGWGCCVDCVNLREPFSWEVTQGALYLLREVCTLTQRCRGSSSCDEYTESYVQQQEAMAVSLRKGLLQQSWVFHINRSGSSYEKRSSHGSSSCCVGLFALLELLRTEVDDDGTVDGNRPAIDTLPQRIRHPLKNIEKLHPTVYEELPDILDGLTLWNVLRIPKENNTLPNQLVSGLSSSLLTSFWQETMTFLCRDLILTDEQPTKSASRQARSAMASRRFAAEKCFTRLFDQFKAARRKVDNESEDGYRWAFLRLFAPDFLVPQDVAGEEEIKLEEDFVKIQEVSPSGQVVLTVGRNVDLINAFTGFDGITDEFDIDALNIVLDSLDVVFQKSIEGGV
eukprot:gene7225-5200_t